MASVMRKNVLWGFRLYLDAGLQGRSTNNMAFEISLTNGV